MSESNPCGYCSACLNGVPSECRNPDVAGVSVAVPRLALPHRIVVGSNGAYWRDFGSTYSMAPNSTDNDPVARMAVYELVETNVWLIERGQPEKQEPTVWWSGDEKVGWGGWTTEAWRAVPYATRGEADAVIAEGFTDPRGRGRSAHAVEHGFDHRHHPRDVPSKREAEIMENFVNG